jgi:hypothetical protein
VFDETAKPMGKKKANRVSAKKKSQHVGDKTKPSDVYVASELSDAEQDLLSHMEQGWQLETDSLGGNPVLHDPKGGQVVRPPSANRSTIQALVKRGLIVPGKAGEPLTITWRLKKERK